jgi:DNA-binding SARP family transcriptional activator
MVAIDPATPGTPMQIALSGSFDLIAHGRRVHVSRPAERLLAFLALSERPVRRARLAGSLWLDASDQQAAGNLRTTLWRLQRQAGHIVDAHDDRLSLARDVGVDIGELTRLCNDLIEGPDRRTLSLVPVLLSHGELLADWDDEWVVADRERFRLLRLAALESAAANLLDRGDLHQALAAILGATQAEPLRESSRRILVRIHLADGNAVEAIRAYREYRDLLADELGLRPTAAMEELLGSVRQRDGAAWTDPTLAGRMARPAVRAS